MKRSYILASIACLMLWLIPTPASAQAIRMTTNGCGPNPVATQATYCHAIMSTVPDIVSSGTVQSVDLTGTGAIDHKFTWTTTSAPTSISVVIAACSSTCSTLTTSTNANSSYSFAGGYRSVSIAITIVGAGISANSTYWGQSAQIAVTAEGADGTALATEATQLLVLGAVTDTSPVSVNLAGASSGGATPNYILSDGATVGYVVKASPGMLYKLDITNVLAAAMYVRAYNLAAAACGSATGLVANWIIPAATTGAGGSFSFPVGKEFTTGIVLCITSNISTTSTTAVASASVAVSYDYD